MCFAPGHSHGDDGHGHNIAEGHGLAVGTDPLLGANERLRSFALSTASREEIVAAVMTQARYLAEQPEFLNLQVKSFPPGYAGYNRTKPGDKVMICVDSNVDLTIPTAITSVLREKGATVDLVVVDGGPDRPIDETDEMRALIRRSPWIGFEETFPIRRFSEVPWVTKLVKSGDYDLLIQGRAYPSEFDAFRWEGHPWNQVEQFVAEANNFPREVHELINRKAWDSVWLRGRGARVHISDPEGTDFTYTLLDEYWDESVLNWFEEAPCIGHLMYHPAPPINAKQDATGVIKGTISHFSRPFPQLSATLENGLITSVEGGGEYGAAWRELMTETEEIHYPDFPRPGLFWLWEIAVGTNPKVRRTSNIEMVSSGGTEWERWRSGVIHMGFGTSGPSDCEHWAGERGYAYGHLHMHMMFPTVEIIHADGSVEVPVKNGHLAALDDPEVRECAAKYGDPDVLLKEDWIPEIPGVSMPGSYEVYARDPKRWIPEMPSSYQPD